MKALGLLLGFGCLPSMGKEDTGEFVQLLLDFSQLGSKGKGPQLCLRAKS